MASITVSWFTRAAENSIGGSAWTGSTMKVALLSSVPDQDTPTHWSDLSSTEVTGTNWPAGGVALANLSHTTVTANNDVELHADSISQANVTISGVNALAVYADSGTPSTSELWGYGSFATPAAATDGTFTLNWDANGLLRLTAA